MILSKMDIGQWNSGIIVNVLLVASGRCRLIGVRCRDVWNLVIQRTGYVSGLCAISRWELSVLSVMVIEWGYNHRSPLSLKLSRLVAPT